jgi:hypothetical protein
MKKKSEKIESTKNSRERAACYVPLSFLLPHRAETLAATAAAALEIVAAAAIAGPPSGTSGDGTGPFRRGHDLAPPHSGAPRRPPM